MNTTVTNLGEQQYVCVFLSEWSSIHVSNICGNSYQVVKKWSVLCVLCILVIWHNLSHIKFGPSWTKYCLNQYSLTQLKVELGCLNINDPCWHERDYIQSLITILFIVDIGGGMAPICVRMLGCTPMQTYITSLTLTAVMLPVSLSMIICVHYYHSYIKDTLWQEQDYIQHHYHHFIHCRHRNDGPHLCEDVRLYLDGNLNALVCLLPSFLFYVSLRRLIIDGASIVMSMLSTLYREQPKSTSPYSNFLFWSY
jgi:hypothetical protein